METVYYVTHPEIRRTAVVFAPSTAKARTTFLDWLERNGMIRRGDRQAVRRNLIAERMEDSNVPSDVQLYYGYEESPPNVGFERQSIVEDQPIIEDQPLVMQESEPRYSHEEEMEERVPEEYPRPIEQDPRPIEQGPRKRLMPIQKMMLGGM